MRAGGTGCTGHAALRLPTSALASILLLVGCGGEPAPEPDAGGDEDGVRVVRSEAPLWGAESPWSLSDTPILDLTRTGMGPAHEFYRVTALLRLTGGEIAVGDFGTHQVRGYSPEGALLWASGRQGEGPGEFRWITDLSRTRGDSIVVFDRSLARATILDGDGTLGRVVSLNKDLQRVRHLLSYDDSLFLALGEAFGGARTPGNYRIPYAVILLNPEGSVVDTLRMIGGEESFLSGSGVDGSLPFGKNGHLAVGGKDFLIGTADSLAFDRYSGPGTQSQAVSVSGFDLRLTSQQIDSTRQAMLTRGDGLPHPSNIIEAIESIEFPDHRPGYVRLLLDEEGYAWAAQHRMRRSGPASVVWEVFSPAGQWLGRFEAPVGFRIHQIGSDYILGVQIDAFDVEHVQVRALSRGS